MIPADNGRAPKPLEVLTMMVFRTLSGREIVYVETRWSRTHVYPQLARACAKGLMRRVA